MTEHPWTTHPQSDRDVTLDSAMLRALSHPVRVSLLRLLREQGPSTASRLAVPLGLNSGATSYHLRQLQKVGMVVEDESLGTGRDRWWRAAYRSSYLEPTQVDEQDMDTVVGYLSAVASGYAEAMMRAVQVWPALEAEWRDGATVSDYRLRLTAAEATALLTELTDTVARYRREDDVNEGVTTAPPDARRVVIQLQALPEVES